MIFQWQPVALSPGVEGQRDSNTRVLLIERLKLHSSFAVTAPLRLRSERGTDHSPSEVKDVARLRGLRLINCLIGLIKRTSKTLKSNEDGNTCIYSYSWISKLGWVGRKKS
jgi:hypothetical protein